MRAHLDYHCRAHFVELHNLQVALRNLARVRVGVGLWSGVRQRFANCACTISKLRSATCKLSTEQLHKSRPTLCFHESTDDYLQRMSTDIY